MEALERLEGADAIVAAYPDCLKKRTLIFVNNELRSVLSIIKENPSVAGDYFNDVMALNAITDIAIALKVKNKDGGN